ncbi:hypothetical protein GGTG_10110 [Gaeumannomyces tritici R3-111a-1]|uniref:Uncharacterized protein n=1 Tax=Gaeumannomyces tritici (strain R3-111a-1) TaxID=644352 RepID=J3P9C7_GAET3|nr:hypothetical protein GGTG_10110 [Gaeumannomyces tritici R3-111a-1]EJT73263.1 hypothetical protein GGTG_10110 [Gaeumannomyces tritici R3-111a-1]
MPCADRTVEIRPVEEAARTLHLDAKPWVRQPRYDTNMVAPAGCALAAVAQRSYGRSRNSPATCENTGAVVVRTGRTHESGGGTKSKAPDRSISSHLLLTSPLVFGAIQLGLGRPGRTGWLAHLASKDNSIKELPTPKPLLLLQSSARKPYPPIRSLFPSLPAHQTWNPGPGMAVHTQHLLPRMAVLPASQTCMPGDLPRHRQPQFSQDGGLGWPQSCPVAQSTRPGSNTRLRFATRRKNGHAGVVDRRPR